MSQTPITVTYSLEEILGQINQKLDNLQKDVTVIKIEVAEVKGEIKALDTKLTGQIKELDAKLTGQIKEIDAKLTGEIRELGATVNGVGKRLDKQEFINRSVIVGFILAVGAGVVKLFFPNFPSNP